MKIFFLMFLAAMASIMQLQAQTINLAAYADIYFAADNDYTPYDTTLNFLDNHGRKFSYSNHYKDQFGLNTAQITARISLPNKLRSTITLHTGHLHKVVLEGTTISTLIQEANLGFRMLDSIWLDAGYFLTHIGCESVLPKSNWLSSYSLVSYFEPFYQAGLRLSYEKQDFTAQLHLLNGNGIFEDNNSNKSFGWLFSFTPKDYISASYSGIIGNEAPWKEPSNIHQLHDFVLTLSPFDKLDIRFQLDFASKKVPSSNDSTELKDGSYFGAAFFLHYHFNSKLSATFRAAYVDNSDGVELINKWDVFTGSGLTLGAEYKPTDNSYIRLEGSTLNFKDKYKYFYDINGKPINSRSEVILNFGVWMD